MIGSFKHWVTILSEDDRGSTRMGQYGRRQIPGAVSRQASTPRSYLVRHHQDKSTELIEVARSESCANPTACNSTSANAESNQHLLCILEQKFDLHTNLICSSEEEVHHVTELLYKHVHVRLF